MTKSVNQLIGSLLILTSFAIAPAIANEDRTKKDLSEIQNALKQSEADLAAQRKDIAKLQQTLKAFELNIAKNAKALSIAKQSIKETEAQQAAQQRQANKLKQQQQKLHLIN